MVVTFDFDDTLLWTRVIRDEDGEYVDHVPVGQNPQIFPILRRALQTPGVEVYVVTSRRATGPSVKQVFDYLREWGILEQPQFMGVRFTNGNLKADTLVKLGSVRHYDDDPEELAALPPEIKSVQAFPHPSWTQTVNLGAS